MIKIVPDPPPAGALPHTADTPFGACAAGHPPLFSVRAGIEAHDALVHASMYLRCAHDTGMQACDKVDADARGMIWATLHSVEMAKGLVDALLDGIETQALERKAAR
ncbi:hypothetical protein D3C81_1097810 [compost metagenome]